MNFKEIFENIWTSQQLAKRPCHLPAWWMITHQAIVEQGNPLSLMQNQESQIQENTHPWFRFSDVMQTVINFWQRKSKKWGEISLTILMEKLYLLPGDILLTSFSLEDAGSLEKLWTSYANMEETDETECLAYQWKKITSISSTIAAIPEAHADVSSKKKFDLLENLAQTVAITSPYINSREPTGTMSSSISFLQNGELVKYGLEEKVGKHRLTVNFNIFFILTIKSHIKVFR
jgi:hypothetical protein